MLELEKIEKLRKNLVSGSDNKSVVIEANHVGLPECRAFDHGIPTQLAVRAPLGFGEVMYAEFMDRLNTSLATAYNSEVERPGCCARIFCCASVSEKAQSEYNAIQEAPQAFVESWNQLLFVPNDWHVKLFEMKEDGVEFTWLEFTKTVAAATTNQPMGLRMPEQAMVKDSRRLSDSTDNFRDTSYYTATDKQEEEIGDQDPGAQLDRSSADVQEEDVEAAPWNSAGYLPQVTTTGTVAFEQAATCLQGFIEQKYSSSESLSSAIKPGTMITVVETPADMPVSEVQKHLTKEANSEDATTFKRNRSTTEFTTLDAIVQSATDVPSATVESSPMTQALQYSPAFEASMSEETQNAELASISSQMAQTTLGDSYGSLESISEVDGVPKKRQRRKKFNNTHKRVKK